jgi:hypothetical protein
MRLWPRASGGEMGGCGLLLYRRERKYRGRQCYVVGADYCMHVARALHEWVGDGRTQTAVLRARTQERKNAKEQINK